MHLNFMHCTSVKGSGVMPMPHMCILQCPNDMNFLIRCVLATKDPAAILVQQNVCNQMFCSICNLIALQKLLQQGQMRYRHGARPPGCTRLCRNYRAIDSIVISHSCNCSQRSKQLKNTVKVQVPVWNGPTLQRCNSLQTGMDCNNIMWVGLHMQ